MKKLPSLKNAKPHTKYLISGKEEYLSKSEICYKYNLHEDRIYSYLGKPRLRKCCWFIEEKIQQKLKSGKIKYKILKSWSYSFVEVYSAQHIENTFRMLEGTVVEIKLTLSE